MPRLCCVCKCSRQDAILHHFPCNEKRLNNWLQCLNRDDLRKLSPEELSKLFVCQKHFEQQFISSKSLLLSRAYPSLFTDEEITSGIPNYENKENMDMVYLIDHTYARREHCDHTYSKKEPLRDVSVSISDGFRNLPGTSQNLPTYIGSENADEAIASGSSAGQQALDLERQNLDRTFLREVKKPGSKQRLIKNIAELPPKYKIIYDEYKKAKKQVSFYQRAKRASKFNKDKFFEKLTQNMNPYAKRLMKMQINLCTKSKKGRRYTTEEKLIALSIMKQSPKCYRFLHKIFIVPSKATLNKMVSRLNIKTGICPQICELMKKEVAGWDDKKKLCSIIFDEMSLETALTYSRHRDSINGFVELNNKKHEFADHALVFMLRGAVYKWQQPVAYYFCRGATSGIDLKIILKSIIAAVVGCGLKPVALICDQGAAFQSALKSFRVDTRREQILANEEPDDTIIISGTKLSIIYDPSHLIKGLRNNFLNKSINMNGKISTWKDIIDVYEADCKHAEVRLLHKLNDEHVIPDKIKKMKVKNCVKVFSATVSAALSYTANFCEPVSQYKLKSRNKRQAYGTIKRVIRME